VWRRGADEIIGAGVSSVTEFSEMDQGWLEVVTIAVVLGGLAALGLWLRLDEGRRRKGRR
jgi:hypothetical protein